MNLSISFCTPIRATLLWLLPACALAQGSYYTEAGTYATRRESDPPAYVRNMGEKFGAQWRWLELGLEERLRAEYRDDDIRRTRSAGRDTPLLRRTRAWVGAHHGPLGVVAELTDSRRDNSRFAADNRDVNAYEFIQTYAELRVDDLLPADPRGNARPLLVRTGRQAFELLDRRLVARNEWRNTTNTFDGVRVSLGQDSNDWQLELLSLHPVTRIIDARDRRDDRQRFDALIAHWRTRSPLLTLEPHLFRLQEDGGRTRDIRATGLRAYGNMRNAAINYDVSVLAQRGSVGLLDHDAIGYTAEVGYTFTRHPWRPRASVFYGHADGDRSPADARSNRFERFFGFARPWSASDYIQYENLRAPKLRLEFQPAAALRIDIGYSAYWLASSTDRLNSLMNGTGNRDPLGQSGKYVGSEFDGRVRVTISPYAEATIGYAHFRSGTFVRARQQAALGESARDSDFLYAELVLRLF
ncbi:MAG TPA: alginate export family protein [Pseudomonadales bacterium]